MSIDAQIEQTRIALQILEGRKQGTEPEWEYSMPGGVKYDGMKVDDPCWIISRSMYIRLKPATLTPGFLPWHGGECPVAGDIEVQILCREAGPQAPYRANSYRWDHRNDADDIIAYRIIEPDPYAEFRAANSQGKEIQALTQSGDWLPWKGGSEFHPTHPKNLRIKPSEPKQPSIKLGDWIRDSEVLEEYLVTGSRDSAIRVNGQWTKLSDLHWNTLQISSDQGATWNPINSTL